MRGALVAAFASLLSLRGTHGVAVAEPPVKMLLRHEPRSPLLLTQEEHASPAVSTGVPRNYVVQKLREIPHVDKPWTQGLEFSDGQLIETSGDYPQGIGSSVRVVNPSTGDTVRKITSGFESPLFLEGITRIDSSWFASTFNSYKLFELDDQFNLVTSHEFPWEGWGLARGVGGATFLATNSTEYVMTVDAKTFETTSAKAVKCFGKRVAGLNELEVVDDFFGRGPALLGNVINTRLVLVLDPSTLRCTGVFHLNNLEPVQPEEQGGLHVA